MVLFNYSTKELTAKVVYYGPGLCGKTTNLQYIHGNLPENVKGKMLSLATKTDRTLFFDFLPLDLGNIRGMKTRVQLYTVPGQVFYNETRKLVLKGADGIVFVADSQEQMAGANVESFKNLEENLKAHGMNLADMPHVIQFNKRDLPKLSGIEEMNSAINRYNAPFYESVATTGIGVQDTLKAITKLVLLHLTKKYDPKKAPDRKEPAAAMPTASQPTAAVKAPAPPAAAAASDRSIPLSEPSEPAVPIAEPNPQPTQPLAKSGPNLPPPPDFRGDKGQDSAPGFGDSEIDDFMGEVEHAPPEDQPTVEEPAAAEPELPPSLEDVASTPKTQEAPSDHPPVSEWAPVEDEQQPGVVPEEALESPVPLAASSSEDSPAAMEEPSSMEIDRGFDPEWPQGAAGGLQTAEPASEELIAPFPPPVLEEEEQVPETDDVALVEEKAIAYNVEMQPEPGLEQGPPTNETPKDLQVEEPETFEEQQHEILTPFPVPDAEDEAAEPDPPREIPVMEAQPEANAEPQVQEEVTQEPEEIPVVLTEVAGDESLFDDPDLEIARMAEGESREIIVPVVLEKGENVRRFKLSLTLKFDKIQD